MWKINPPKPVKLIIGILAADSTSLAAAVDSITAEFGQIDFLSDAWDFFQTDYYKDQTGENIIRQFAVIEKLIDPSRLAEIKHRTNGIEQNLAAISRYLQIPRITDFAHGKRMSYLFVE